jgi:hypothetical protein
MIYQCNGRKMNEGINLFYSKKDLKSTNVLNINMLGSCGPGDKQRPVVPKIVGSIPPCARKLLFFMQ